MRYTKTLLETTIAESACWKEVCEKLGCKSSTGSQTYLMRKARSFGLTWEKFPGRAHRKGKEAFNKKDAMTYCIKGRLINSHRLKNYLIRDGYKKPECENCSNTHWMGELIVLELDHVDNDHSNNEFANLKILCPNCHALKTRKSYLPS